MLHSILSKLPKPLDLDLLISNAAALYKSHPPHRLSGWSWAAISKNSVLKTTQKPGPLAKQTLQDGEKYYKRQAAEIRNQEARKKALDKARLLAERYKRPALATTTAVLAVLIALYLRRSGSLAASLGILLHPLSALRTRAADLLHRFT